MEIRIIEFGSSHYRESVILRDVLLRKPLGLSFKEEDLDLEFDSVHVACFNDEQHIVACLILKPLNTETAKMRQVAVDESYQGKGVGRYLVEASEHIASRMGYEKISLNARSNVVDFYLRLGYECVGEEFEEVGIPHFNMNKSILDVL